MLGSLRSDRSFVLPLFALLHLLAAEKLLDFLNKGFDQFRKMFRCLQERSAHFLQPVVLFLQSFRSGCRAEILLLIVGNAVSEVVDFFAACDPLLCKRSKLLIIVLGDGNLTGDSFLPMLSISAIVLWTSWTGL